MLQSKVNAIVSVTRDDEIITSDSLAMIFILFAASEIISQTKLSIIDTGVSQKEIIWKVGYSYRQLRKQIFRSQPTTRKNEHWINILYY